MGEFEPQNSVSPEAPRVAPLGWVVRGVLVVGVLAVGGGISQFLVATKPMPDASASVEAALKVRVFQVRKVPQVARQWVGQGTAVALDSADVPARLTAVVAEIPDRIEAGRPVRAGQVIARLDDEEYRAQVEIAQQSLEEAKIQLAQLATEKKTLQVRQALRQREVAITRDELRRAEALAAKSATTRREVDLTRRELLQSQILLAQLDQSMALFPQRQQQLESTVKRLTASLALAQLNVKRCEVVSPIDGVLQAVDVEVGESLNPAQRVARVVQLARIEVPVQLPASAREDVALGATARIQGSGGKRWMAKIVRVAPEQDPQTRTFTAYAVVDQTDQGDSAAGALMPGSYVRVVVSSPQAQPRWVVPRRSVVAGRLLLVRDGMVQSQAVKTLFGFGGRVRSIDLPDEQWVVLADDASLEGQWVVLNAARSITDGQKVKPVRITKAGNQP